MNYDGTYNSFMNSRIPVLTEKNVPNPAKIPARSFDEGKFFETLEKLKILREATDNE
jgi:predicted nucleic acid-binding protein